MKLGLALLSLVWTVAPGESVLGEDAPSEAAAQGERPSRKKLAAVIYRRSAASDLRALCRGDCGLVRDSDLRSFCRGDCGFIAGSDARSACRGECGLIGDSDLRSFCRGDCGLVGDSDSRSFCRGECGLIGDPALRSFCRGDCGLVPGEGQCERSFE
jgi:hypothetical protein